MYKKTACDGGLSFLFEAFPAIGEAAVPARLFSFGVSRINDDGSFNVADVVQLHNYLLGKIGTDILNWRAADICRDGINDLID